MAPGRESALFLESHPGLDAGLDVPAEATGCEQIPRERWRMGLLRAHVSMTEAALDRLLGSDDLLSFSDLSNLLSEPHCYVVSTHALQWLNTHLNFVLLKADSATMEINAEFAPLAEQAAHLSIMVSNEPSAEHGGVSTWRPSGALVVRQQAPECTTRDGSAPKGSMCSHPFVAHDRTYAYGACAPADPQHSAPWCYTTRARQNGAGLGASLQNTIQRAKPCVTRA